MEDDEVDRILKESEDKIKGLNLDLSRIRSPEDFYILKDISAGKTEELLSNAHMDKNKGGVPSKHEKGQSSLLMACSGRPEESVKITSHPPMVSPARTLNFTSSSDESSEESFHHRNTSKSELRDCDKKPTELFFPKKSPLERTTRHTPIPAETSSRCLVANLPQQCDRSSFPGEKTDYFMKNRGHSTVNTPGGYTNKKSTEPIESEIRLQMLQRSSRFNQDTIPEIRSTDLNENDEWYLSRLEKETELRLEREVGKIRQKMNTRLREELRRVESEYQGKLNILKKEIALLNNHLSRERYTQGSKQKALRHELEVAIRMGEQQDKNLQLMKKEIDDLRSRNTRLIISAEKLQEERNRFKKNLSVLNEERQQLERELLDEKELNRQLNENLNFLKSRVEILAAERESIERKMLDEVCQKEQLEDKVLKLVKSLKETSFEHRNCLKSVCELERNLETQSNELNDWRNKAQELQQQLRIRVNSEKEKHTEIQELKSEEQKLKKEISNLSEKILRYQSDKESLLRQRREWDSSREKYEETEKELFSLRSQVKQLSADKKKASEENKRLNNDLLDVRQQFFKLKKDSERLRVRDNNPIFSNGAFGEVRSPRNICLESPCVRESPYKKKETLETSTLDTINDPGEIDDPSNNSRSHNVEKLEYNLLQNKESPCPEVFNTMSNSNRQKQLMLLEVEKNDLELESRRYPSYGGKTYRERKILEDLESRMEYVDKTIHEIRQELPGS